MRSPWCQGHTSVQVTQQAPEMTLAPSALLMHGLPFPALCGSALNSPGEGPVSHSSKRRHEPRVPITVPFGRRGERSTGHPAWHRFTRLRRKHEQAHVSSEGFVTQRDAPSGSSHEARLSCGQQQLFYLLFVS